MSHTYVVHKMLLCRYSRYFNEELGRPWDTLAIAESIWEIERSGDKYLSYEAAPAGYIPSWVTLIENCRKEDEDQISSAGQRETTETVITLPEEYPHFFGVFIHWLYTQNLAVEDEPWCRPLIVEQTLVYIYGLAERLDVPQLRRQCYSELRDKYSDMSTLPDTTFMETVIEQCSDASLLRKYMIGMVAYNMISGSSKEICNDILALDENFSRQVAQEIVNRLLSDEGSKDPSTEDKFNVDDSDSDVDWSSDDDSDGNCDSDDNMSDADERDSIFDPEDVPMVDQEAQVNVEDVPVESGEQQIKSEETQADLDHSQSETAQPLPTVEEEWVTLVSSRPSRTDSSQTG